MFDITLEEDNPTIFNHAPKADCFWPELIGTGASVVGSLISGTMSSDAATDAANTQAVSANQATQAQLERFYQSRKDLEPWRSAGAEALGELATEIEQGPGDYVESPYYNFLLDEGVKAIDRSASARGMLDSGATAKELVRFGQGTASKDYQNWLSNWLTMRVNPLQSIAGAGQNAASRNAANAMTTGSNIANNAITRGNALAGGAINAANAKVGGIQGVTGAINQGINNWLFSKYLGGEGGNWLTGLFGGNGLGTGAVATQTGAPSTLGPAYSAISGNTAGSGTMGAGVSDLAGMTGFEAAGAGSAAGASALGGIGSGATTAYGMPGAAGSLAGAQGASTLGNAAIGTVGALGYVAPAAAAVYAAGSLAKNFLESNGILGGGLPNASRAQQQAAYEQGYLVGPGGVERHYPTPRAGETYQQALDRAYGEWKHAIDINEKVASGTPDSPWRRPPRELFESGSPSQRELAAMEVLNPGSSMNVVPNNATNVAPVDAFEQSLAQDSAQVPITQRNNLKKRLRLGWGS